MGDCVKATEPFPQTLSSSSANESNESPSYKERIMNIIEVRRKEATESLVDCVKIETLLSKKKLSFDELEEFAKFYYRY